MADELDIDAGFPEEEIQQALEQAVQATMDEVNCTWDEAKVAQQINDITEAAMKNLAELKLPYKYVVNCMLVQKTDRPLYSSFSTFLENNIDGQQNYVYPPIRNKESASKSMQCFASVHCFRF